MEFETIIALVTSVSAFLISLINITINKRKISTETISKNRIDWIKDVRELVAEFISLYVNKAPKNEQKIIRNKICLYMRSGVISYSEFLDQMDICINEDYSDENCNKLISKAQIVFSDVWIRMKMESGIKNKDDKRFEELFNNK